ncbi:hypothetical protein QFZ20_000133 [Flavobacterium sp. W4I14]|nr:hypothetical protein [Flavobacterium sp. W4I14]
MNGKFDLHDKREQNKIGLETYSLDKTNVFDIAIDKLIEELKKNISKSNDQYDGWNKLRETDPVRYAELVEQAERHDISLDQQQYEYFLDIMYDEEQLLSLVEMKIIYAFKSLEINIKKLLSAAFSLQSTKDFYKWDNLIKFLKDKNIDATKFDSYFEITQLKSVNNAIKHSDDYETSLLSIQEFKNSDNITYNKVDHFYNRTKHKPTSFLDELVTAIYQELYEFEESKIEEIARSLVLRMKKEDAAVLTQKISEHYS